RYLLQERQIGGVERKAAAPVEDLEHPDHAVVGGQWHRDDIAGDSAGFSVDIAVKARIVLRVRHDNRLSAPQRLAYDSAVGGHPYSRQHTHRVGVIVREVWEIKFLAVAI